MATKDHTAVEQSTAVTHSAIVALAALATLIGAVLAAGYYIWNLAARVGALEKAKSDASQVQPSLSDLSVRMERIEASSTTVQLEGLDKEIKSNDDQIDQMTSSISDLKAHMDRVDEVSKDNTDAISGSLSRTTDLEANVGQIVNDLTANSTTTTRNLSRISVLEGGVSDLQGRMTRTSEYLASEAYDTVYVFKHTFDFPNPTFDVRGRSDTDEGTASAEAEAEAEAEALACPSEELGVDWTTDDTVDYKGLLDLERRRYQKRLTTFDGSIEFKFYTMRSVPNTIVRQEMTCYEEGNVRMEEAPVVPIMGMESAEDNDDSYGVFKVEHSSLVGFDHSADDIKTYPLKRLPNSEGRQVHRLSATLVDREDNSQDCRRYLVEAAKGELDRCDFQVFVFARMTRHGPKQEG